MNLGGTVAYNGLSINTVTRQAGGLPASGYAVERFAPEPPPPTTYYEKRALADGMDAGDVYLGGREFGLIVTAYGTSAGDFWDKTQALFSAFNPTIVYEANSTVAGFIPFTFFQPTADVSSWPTSAYPNGIPMQYFMRPMAGPSYVIERDLDGGATTAPRSKTFNIRMIARNPRKVHSTEISATITTALQTATYRGDYPYPPIVQFSKTTGGSNTAFKIIVDGFSTIIDISPFSTGTFQLDYDKRTFQNVTAGTYHPGNISQLDGWPEIDSGSTFKLENPTDALNPTLRYYEAFA